MLERFKNIVNKAINKQGKKDILLDWGLSDVQGVFGMKYVNDWLKYNAMNEKQLNNALSFEQHINQLIEKLYVPSYQQKNV